MKQVKKISVSELQDMADKMYGTFVKAVVDVATKSIVLDVEMHYDAEQFLLEQGSKQIDLWGINLYPTEFGSNEFIEYDSMINIRPSQDNSSRGVENDQLRRKIETIVEEVVHV